MFVQSSLPPSPTSITAMSICCSAKYLKASAVVSSKKDGCSGSKKGRPPKLDKKVEEDLIAEVQRLRAENAYLKKLNALVSERVRQEKKHK